ncbi:MAG: glycosyltransferase family 9 protein [Mariprofundaceae bacterium]|nr:glycosyltransferase family 9 protein [Mariprofundaceae bacterium]
MIVCRYLGDVLLATPLARSLSQAGYSVDWLVAPGTATILEGQNYAQRVFIADQHSAWHRQLALGMRLLRKYDMAFALPSTDRAMLFALAASKSTHALIDADRSQDTWKRRIIGTWLDYTPGRHMVSLACELAEAAHLPSCRSVTTDWTEDDAHVVFSALAWNEGTDYLHIHPFARWPYKWWRRDAWRSLIATATEQGLRVVITGSPAEAEQAAALADGFANDAVRVLAGKLNWQQLACLSHHAQAYVGLDTANTHLAAATGTPVIALFGPTDPRIWGPWPNEFSGHSPWQASSASGIQQQGNISLLQGQQDCVPCQLEGCDRHPDSTSECLQEMQAEWVWTKIMHAMNRHAAKTSN